MVNGESGNFRIYYYQIIKFLQKIRISLKTLKKAPFNFKMIKTLNRLAKKLSCSPSSPEPQIAE